MLYSSCTHTATVGVKWLRHSYNLGLKPIKVVCYVTWSSYSFYRAMHTSAKRGIAIACRLSVCPSVT